MEMRDTKGVEAMYNMQHLRLNNVPTSLVEGTGEAIGSRGFVASGTKNSTFNLLLREVIGYVVKIAIRDRDAAPIYVTIARSSSSHDRGEVVLDYCFRMLMIDNPTVVMLESMDKKNPASGVDPYVEVSCVGISLFKIRDPRGLSLPCSLGHGDTNDL
jgi:hypothetical protein